MKYPGTFKTPWGTRQVKVGGFLLGTIVAAIFSLWLVQTILAIVLVVKIFQTFGIVWGLLSIYFIHGFLRYTTKVTYKRG